MSINNNNSTTPTTSVMLLSAQTVKILNITHRSIQLSVTVALFFLLLVVCLGNRTYTILCCRNKVTKKSKKRTMSVQVSVLLNFCLVYSVFRIISEVLRLAAFANPRGTSSPLFGVSHIGAVIIYPGNNTVLALLIESWAQIVALFISHPKILLWTTRVVSIIANLIVYIGWMIPSMFLGWRPGTWQKTLGFNLTAWVGNPAYTAGQVLMVIEITAIGILVLTILKRIRQKVDWAVFSKVSICILVAWLMMIVRMGMTIALGMKLISRVGEWIVFIVHSADLTVLYTLALLFFPYKELSVCFGLSCEEKEEEEEDAEKQRETASKKNEERQVSVEPKELVDSPTASETTKQVEDMIESQPESAV